MSNNNSEPVISNGIGNETVLVEPKVKQKRKFQWTDKRKEAFAKCQEANKKGQKQMKEGTEVVKEPEKVQAVESSVSYDPPSSKKKTKKKMKREKTRKHLKRIMSDHYLSTAKRYKSQDSLSEEDEASDSTIYTETESESGDETSSKAESDIEEESNSSESDSDSSSESSEEPIRKSKRKMKPRKKTVTSNKIYRQLQKLHKNVAKQGKQAKHKNYTKPYKRPERRDHDIISSSSANSTAPRPDQLRLQENQHRELAPQSDNISIRDTGVPAYRFI